MPMCCGSILSAISIQGNLYTLKRSDNGWKPGRKDLTNIFFIDLLKGHLRSTGKSKKGSVAKIKWEKKSGDKLAKKESVQANPTKSASKIPLSSAIN